MGIRSKNTPNKPIHTIISTKFIKKMQRQIANQVQSSMKLFRTAQMSERRSHQSIREIECLRQHPVKDFATWYSKGDAGETRVFLQKIGCTNTSEISFSAQYPSSLPEEFKNMDVTSLREYLESLKAQSRAL